MDNQASDGNASIEVEVVYAKADEQAVVTLNVPSTCTVADAVKLSGLLGRFPEIDGLELKAGIFGEVSKLDHVVKQGDRVEIYRPLLHDPKDARRQRALKK